MDNCWCRAVVATVWLRQAGRAAWAACGAVRYGNGKDTLLCAHRPQGTSARQGPAKLAAPTKPTSSGLLLAPPRLVARLSLHIAPAARDAKSSPTMTVHANNSSGRVSPYAGHQTAACTLPRPLPLPMVTSTTMTHTHEQANPSLALYTTLGSPKNSKSTAVPCHAIPSATKLLSPSEPRPRPATSHQTPSKTVGLV